jgi:AcrR family transcriptional regulator
MRKRFDAFLEKRKADIVTAVLKLVDRVGISGVTTKRIAREVGFVEAALYKHFACKNDIFHMLLEVSELQLRDKFKDLDSRGLDGASWLAEWFRFVIDYLEDFPGIYRILFSDAMYAEDKELFRKFKSITWELKERVETAIRAGMQGRIFRNDLDPETSAIIGLGTIHVAFTLWNVFEERSRSLHDVARPFLAEFMASLRPRHEVVQ